MQTEDVIFIPIGGKYTMDAVQAAEFINGKQSELVVPIHYGDPKVGENFNKLLNPGVKVQIFW